MAIFELIFALLLAGVLLSLLAPKLGVPWPALLALIGAAIAFIPGMPTIELDPDLALALFLAPVLLDAAYDASPRDLRRNWVPVGGLVLVAVGLTTAGVAVVAHTLIPTMPWAAAIALGAIVAPPDAAAATAVLRLVRLPHRMMVVLEGESLLNDASALLLYRAAVAAVAGGVTAWTAPLLALSVAGGVVLGVVLARLYLRTSAHLEQGPAATVIQFIGCFGVWILADRLELSAVLTIVAYAVTISRLAPGRTGARSRRNMYAVWEVVVFVLNVLAFVLVGLQLRGIVERLENLGHAALFAGAVLVTVICVRLAWVLAYGAAWRRRVRGTGRFAPSVQGDVVVAWCGMRGIVTLAAAYALPAGFPHRNLIVFAAFCTVLGTLVLQGFTSRPLLARLSIAPDDTVEQERALARTAIARAVLAELDGRLDSDGGRLLRQDYAARLEQTQAAEITEVIALRRQALAIERRTLLRLLREGRIGDECFHQLEEQLDWAEAESA